MASPRETQFKNKSHIKKRYWIPAVTVILGLMVVILLLMSARINHRLHQGTLFLDEIEDVQINLSNFHLWLEEHQAGDDRVHMEEINAYVIEALDNTDKLLNGGVTEHGTFKDPPTDPKIKRMIQDLRDSILEFKVGESMNADDEGKVAIGSAQDHGFDRLFMRIIDDADRLETLYVEKQTKYNTHAKKLMWSMIAIWASALSIAIIGLIILERRRAKASAVLVDSEERYRDLFQQASDYVLVLDSSVTGAAPVIIDANNAAFRKLGYSEAELLGQPITIIEDNSTGALTPWKEMSSKKTAVFFEAQRIKKDGTEFTVESSIKPGSVVGKSLIFVIERDITRRKEAEEELLSSEKKFRRLFEESPIAILEEDFSELKDYLDKLSFSGVTDLNRYFEHNPTEVSKCARLISVIDVNRTTLKLFRASNKALLSDELVKTFTNRFYEYFANAMAHMTEGNSNGSSETVMRNLDGQLINVLVRFTVSPEFTDSWSRVLVSIIDVSERKQSESLIGELGRILDNSLNEIYIFDARTLKFIEVNRGAVSNLGYSLKELREMTPLEIMPDYNAESFAKLIEPLGKTENEQTLFDTLHKRKDSTLYPVEVHLQHSTLKGKPVFVAINLDISERKRAEEDLRFESEVAGNLLKISEATLHTTDIERLIKDVVIRTHEVLGSSATLSYIWDAETESFRPRVAAGISAELTPLFNTEPIPMNAPILKGALTSAKVRTLALSNPKVKAALVESGLLKWAGEISILDLIPLKGRKRYLGLLICVHRAKTPKNGLDWFSKKRTSFLQAVSNQVSTALEEAWLYKDSINAAMELSRKVETIQTMSEMGKSILSAHESKVILDTTIRMISKLIACDFVRVVIVDQEKSELRFIGGTEGDEANTEKTASFAETTLTEVVASLRVQYISDLSREEDLPLIEKQLLDQGILSLLRTPVIIKNEIFAILGVSARRRSAFTPADRDVLEKLASHIGIALENARLITDLEELFISTVKTLAGTIEAKSKWTRGHSDRVTRYAVEIGRSLGMHESELKALELAGLLHDIGKIGTYESILDKPVNLTTEEQNIIQKHPGKGADILSPIKQLGVVIPGVKLHHEKFDGSGYPEGLKGDEIPLIAKILAVADTVDAMGADRPYRKALNMDEIVTELKKCSGTQFDPEVVEAFLNSREETEDNEG